MKNELILIDAREVAKSYEDGKIQVLHGASLAVQRGEIVALCGPSGGGKSTLLHIIAGIDYADSGEVLIEGQALDSEARRTQMLRERIGFVFQLHNLIPDLTLYENCMIPCVAAGIQSADAKKRLNELVRRTGVGHRVNNRIQDLSGGERQRAAICRALMNRPDIILADEPTGALDENSREQVFSLLLDLVKSEGGTLVMATHDKELAERADRVLTVSNGVVSAE
ncbi:MAG: ABC transporter ATP-binding protein [Verrucomicrobiae bacterium]|nr:ABC transporter ATP-binding protein [Verrucomicrobiae bacterium]NNJ87375.1 ABC transporter ATP-binding protein [Akkermansiaceae bacterium]